jgi:hypothetical protein
MLNQVYHIIYNQPILDSKHMVKDQEKMVQQLVSSGRLRLDAPPFTNFQLLTIPDLGFAVTLSYRELFAPELENYTIRILTDFWSQRMLSEEQIIIKVQSTLELFRNEISKKAIINSEVELKIARILIQSAHPAVWKMLLTERTEIFVTYGHSVGDVLDVVNWKASGENSGLQSTNGRDAAIFISCGGNPFRKTEFEDYGDGKPAIARMMVIGAQEIGHYSDIKRNNLGRQIGRFSANFSATKAVDTVAEARLNDINNCHKIYNIMLECGIESLLEIEKSIAFYKKLKLRLDKKIILYIQHFFLKRLFINKLLARGIEFVTDLKTRYTLIATHLKLIFEDNLVNLDPKAEVYKRDNPQAEEAIKCVEALARVPQQVIKFGKNSCKIFIPNLYRIYYNEVIAHNIKTYEILSGRKYQFSTR